MILFPMQIKSKPKVCNLSFSFSSDKKTAGESNAGLVFKSYHKRSFTEIHI